jgi:hypothetical protein
MIGVAGERAVIAVLVTYRRPAAVTWMLDALRRQTADIAHVVIVDNSPEPSVDPHDPCVTYVHRPENPGPAGGMQVGLHAAWELPLAWEWALLLDDDDPPLDDTAVARVLHEASAARELDADIQLVGLLGSRLNRWTGLLRTSRGASSAVPVDFIGGGYLPLLHRSALRDGDGPFDAALFWGFEELDAGLRIKARGGKVVALDHLAHELGYWRKHDDVRTVQAEATLDRRYYSWRNALAVCRSHRFRVATLSTIARIAISGSAGLVGAPGRGARARVAWRAIRDGTAGNLGRVEPL